MSSLGLAIALPLALLYVAFLLWWGGRGRPMGTAEREAALATLAAADQGDPHPKAALDAVRGLLASDDGREFYMQNLVRYRPKALYPPSHAHLGDDPRKADLRYGKAIVWPLLRYGNLVLLVARRSGDFIVPEGADDWHYVALVRYRSRRDFLRFAIATNRADNFIHKWAAIEKTHVFPVRPVISLFSVRLGVGLVLLSAGLLLHTLLA